MLGSVQPRLWTPPLRELTPATSYGYAVVAFARDVLRAPLDPWQEWAVIHAGELLDDMRPRFRKVLFIVARQNGKTHLLRVLTLFWLFVEQWPMVLGQSTSLSTAKEAWQGAQDMAQACPWLADEFGTVRRDNNDPHWRVASGGKYKIAAANRKGGRGLSVDRLIVDELREHRDWVAYNAALPTLNARPYAQAWFITNQGDDQSVVLNSLRDAGMSALEGAPLDDELALFEWSAPDGARPDDPAALAAANPNLGHRLTLASLLADARRAMEKGGEEEAGFRTEILCQRVRALDAAVDPAAWAACAVPGTLDGLRAGVALCVDVAPDGQHATLAAAAVQPDGRTRVELVASWSGGNAMRGLRRELPALLARVKPRTLGWFPNGPAAALAADLAERKGRTSWPPAGVSVAEIRGEVSAVCMGFAEQVKAGALVHSDEPLLSTHVTAAAKLHAGDAWRFSRKGDGHCDAAYAAAGAAHLARTLPAPIGKPRLIFAGESA